MITTKTFWLISAIGINVLHLFNDSFSGAAVIMAYWAVFALFYYLARIVELLEERDS